ncbi:MAG: hypothetical protein GSR73_02940, partial [Desulfurococcales archaeon]|nr:hypothetical protein [Desulfurococcales archaeon]
AYTDTVYYSGKVLRYSDPIVAWVDGTTGNIVREGTEGARPYYIYTAAGAGPGTQSSPGYTPSAVGSSGSGIAYYDLTQDDLVPYPVPEPWYVSLAVLAIALVAVMYYGRGNR